MCKWIINYRLLSAILLTQMFRRRVSEQRGRIPLAAPLWGYSNNNFFPSAQVVPGVQPRGPSGSCCLPECFSHRTHVPSAFLHTPISQGQGCVHKGTQYKITAPSSRLWRELLKTGISPVIYKRQTLVSQSRIISTMQNGSLMLPSASDIQQGNIYLFKTSFQIKTDNSAESRVMPIMKNNHLKISPSRPLGLFYFDWTGPSFWLLTTQCMAHLF